MIIHIALFKWKNDVSEEEIEKALSDVKELKNKIPGLKDIHCGANFSQWSEGFTHAVVLLATDQSSLDAYRIHPDHQVVAHQIENMEEKSLGVDFED